MFSVFKLGGILGMITVLLPLVIGGLQLFYWNKKSRISLKIPFITFSLGAVLIYLSVYFLGMVRAFDALGTATPENQYAVFHHSKEIASRALHFALVLAGIYAALYATWVVMERKSTAKSGIQQEVTQ